MTMKERTLSAKNIRNTVLNITWKFRDASQLEYYYPEMNSKEKIDCPRRVFDMFSKMYLNETREMFCVLWLNSSNKPLGFEIVSIGNLNSSVVHPREVFRSAIVSSCANIILMHNHPSGNPEPSPEDIKVTKMMVEAGKILNINVFDHIIIAGNSYLSFVERRYI